MENEKGLKEEEEDEEKEVVVIDVESTSSGSGKKKCITRLVSKSSSYLGLKGSLLQKGDEKSEDDSVNILIENNLGLSREENSELVPLTKDKRKTGSGFGKNRKPPRPPKGPSINASDYKMMKEITELKIKRRARIEHIKTLNKIKEAAAKSLSLSSSSPSSSNANTTITAMILTAIFCFLIILQGYSWSWNGSPRMSLEGSPEPSPSFSDMISVKYYNLSPNSMPEAPRSARQRLLLQGSSAHC